MPGPTCKGCGAELVWSVTEGARRPIPLNFPSEKRVILVVKSQGPNRPDEVLARVVDTYVPHHRTCPKADDYRKSKGKKPA